MEGTAYQHYFLQPTDVQQRRYEVLRTVFVEGQSLQDAAQRFGVHYGTVRNWASEFCRQLDAGQRPPFSQFRSMDDRPTQATTTNRSLPSPISMPCPWNRDEG
jgi:transposase-like protein